MKFSILLIIALLLGACATSNYSVGRDFPSDKVSQITKGKTTADEILSWFGQPFSKSTISATEEKWVYSYIEGQAKAVVGSVTSTGTTKTLDVLIEDGVVVNYTFSEGPMSSSVN